jgi:hypothetical protein
VQIWRPRRLIGRASGDAPAAPATLFARSPATSIVVVLHEMSLGGHVTVFSFSLAPMVQAWRTCQRVQPWMGFDAGVGW